MLRIWLGAWGAVACLVIGGLVGLQLASDALTPEATTVKALPSSALARAQLLHPRAAHGPHAPVERGSSVAMENRRPGAEGWYAPRTAAPAIQGFGNQISLRPGQTLTLRVDAHGWDYRVEVLRLGFYGGLGARRVLCIPDCLHGRAGTPQPRRGRPDRLTGEIRAHWVATDAFRVGAGWVSGYYVARLIVTSGPLVGQASLVPFIVRAPAERPSRILVVAPVNTWQAYNAWGDKDFYKGGSRGRPATHVSFERPFKYLDLIFSWEYPLLRFLERQGYDLSYASDVDVDRDPGLLRRYRLVVVAGHGEYWSMRERRGFDDAVDGGVNLAFMGADTGYWQVRYENRGRTIVGYKHRRDPLARTHPQLATTRFRQLKRPALPECELLGAMYSHGIGVAESEERGVGPSKINNVNIEAAVGMPSTVSPAAARTGWLEGTGLHPGSRLRVVGGEWDQVFAHCRRPVVVLHRGGRNPQDTVTYRAKSGARVFSAGSLVFLWTLDNSERLVPPHEHPKHLTDGRMQRLMCNVFSDLSSEEKRSTAPCHVVGPP